ncbi:MAG: hypothetical protein IJI52_06950 [Solobacterium sp.]|nr:hypothetical protein [Solobacterium sp.]
MAVQQQNAPTRSADLFAETEEQKNTTGRGTAAKTEKKGSSWKKFFLSLLTVAVAYAGLQFYNRTALFVNKSSAPDGYLALEDYLLVDEDMEPTDSLNSLFFEDQWIYRSYADYYDARSTTFGLAPGASWQEFVELYGDYTAYSIHIDPEEEVPYNLRDDEYYSTHYLEYMNIADFDRDYIQSGRVDLKDNSIYISFRAAVWGNKIAYSEKEYQKIIDRHYDSMWPDGSVFDPLVQRYELEFDFYPSSHHTYETVPDGTLEYISTYHYAY